ncbi:hypothetical protein EV196_10276 [Mariniflexile fucanivorans]|uniref:Uncharacterized protein n=1 Tax=Mariniflexile fucanivorans TaxID=264023 RepID=A0A4R1RNL6_9FLAO|nr:hypothetical protein [Mariniflexile fucanivorans]TCL67520.1 hypothetical protein EV196_10276 [Mariniflexile fucanivorans]
MGIFGKLFGNNNKKPFSSEMRSEYNLMTNISLINMVKYENISKYKPIEDGIYEDLTDDDEAKFRMTISYELESDNTNNQYPLEDILDKYLIHVSESYEAENEQGASLFIIELSGSLEKIQDAKEIIGKKVFNREFIDSNGQVSVNLVIE